MDMEDSLNEFLQTDARRHGVTPMRDTEIFLRGLLRNLWDIDRLVRVMNPADELERFSKNTLVLSVLRVMTYEMLWSTRDVKWFGDMTNKLTERCGGLVKGDRDWIEEAIVRMKGHFLKQQLELDFGDHIMEQA